MLSEGDADRIAGCVRAAEGGTSAEIAVCVVRASGDDRGVAAAIGVLALIMAYALLASLLPDLGYPAHLGGALGLATIAYVTADRWNLGLKLLPARLVARDARRAARAVFLDRGLDTTPARNAVLLFVSRAERYVEILPDRGLAAAVPAQRWANIVAAFQATARQKGMVDAVADAVARIGAVCAGPYPATADNPDLIPNRPGTE